MEHILDNIQTALTQLTWVEIIAVITGIIYVVLAAKENIWCWLFGIISSALSVYAMFALFQLYIDAALYAYYVAIGVYGWYQWSNDGTPESNTLKISIYPITTHIGILLGGSVISILVGYFFDTYTTAAATYLDAFTTIFSIITTVMVTRKILENWLYWIVIDAVYIYLYSSRGGYLFAFLMLVYAVIAVVGYLNWKKEWEKQSALEISNSISGSK